MPTLLRHLPFALGFAALATVWLHAQAPVYDLILRNGRVVDGAGNPWFRADVAIAGDTIARVAPAIDGRAAREIDVGGQVVAPGFIDIHTHARRGIDQNPTAPNYVRQGVTTLMEGPMARRRFQSHRFWPSSRPCRSQSTSAASSARARFDPRSSAQRIARPPMRRSRGWKRSSSRGCATAHSG